MSDMPPEDVQQLVSDLCYVFPAVGMTDLSFCLRNENGTSVCFMREGSHVEFPCNGFYHLERDASRYRTTFGIYSATMSSRVQTVPADLKIVQAFVSVANVNRCVLESECCDGKSYHASINCYSNAIRLSGDESAIKILRLIDSRPETVMFCSTDDELASLVPEPVRKVVSEAFAGLSLCAMHEGRVLQSVGYGCASLFKHNDSLPMFNCCRLVAAVRQDTRALLYLTEMVLLPFYIRTKKDELYKKELDLWGPLAKASVYDCMCMMVY